MDSKTGASSNPFEPTTMVGRSESVPPPLSHAGTAADLRSATVVSSSAGGGGADLDPDKEITRNKLRKSRLDDELKNPKVVLDTLRLMIQIHRALPAADAAT